MRSTLTQLILLIMTSVKFSIKQYIEKSFYFTFVSLFHVRTDVLTGLVPEKDLEVIVTGVCVGVAIIMCLWMTCFAIEKRVQTQ